MLYYLNVKKQKNTEAVYKLSRFHTLLLHNTVNSIVYVETVLKNEKTSYILIDTKNEHDELIFKQIYQYFGSKLVTKHMNGQISLEEIKLLIEKPKAEIIKLEPGANIDIPWATGFKNATVKTIQGGFVYVIVNDASYPVPAVLKIDIKKIKTINNITIDEVNTQN